jgi:hypothetical protein
MANKMNNKENLRDDLLSGLIRSEKPLRAPQGFKENIMNRISAIPAAAKIQPYKPPVWLKWGIPGLIMILLTTYITTSPDRQPVKNELELSLMNRILQEVSGWFSGVKFESNLPDIILPETIIWVIGGGLILAWSFLLLAQFLHRKVRH